MNKEKQISKYIEQWTNRGKMEKTQLVYAANSVTSGRSSAESNSYNGAY